MQTNPTKQGFTLSKNYRSGFSLTYNKGFTLIELLVVVLIIGILSAVALPQYEKAVEKSRASEAIMMLKSLRDQQALCYMEREEGCHQGGEGENLFDNANIALTGDPDPDCWAPTCGPATQNFSYYLDGQYIGAARRPCNTKYYLETTAYEQEGDPAYDQIKCDNNDDSKDWCKIIGFKKDATGTYVQP